MKKKTKTIAGGAVALGALLYYVIAGNPGSGEQLQQGSDPVSVETSATSASSSAGALEIPAPVYGNKIIRHDAYVTSYNPDNRIADWVAYELTAEESSARKDRDGLEFRMDPDLHGCTQAMREDYTGSGWTKGHLMPAADAAFDSQAMSETFYLTNVCPQTEALNAGDWQYLEKQVRAWARRYGSVFVVTGPIVGENRYGTIGDRYVVVPDYFYKALLVQRKDGSYSSVAFVMGNDDERYYLRDCYMTVDELEEMTGMDFFPALDDKIEEKVEGSVRRSDWGIK